MWPLVGLTNTLNEEHDSQELIYMETGSAGFLETTVYSQLCLIVNAIHLSLMQSRQGWHNNRIPGLRQYRAREPRNHHCLLWARQSLAEGVVAYWKMRRRNN